MPLTQEIIGVRHGPFHEFFGNEISGGLILEADRAAAIGRWAVSTQVSKPTIVRQSRKQGLLGRA